MRVPLAAFCLLVGFLPLRAANYLSVQTQEGVVREAPGPFARPLHKLAYGDLVQVLGTQGAWTQVRGTGNIQGWMHQNSLTRKRLVTGAGGATAASGASAGEVGLAAKGFNSSVEAKYREQHRQADFGAIDRMETWRIGEAESLKFLREGGLKPGGASL
jgi:hypothetical protein